jgi:hypothetical protein
MEEKSETLPGRTRTPLRMQQLQEADIKQLEKRALNAPEEREMVLSILNDYTYKFRGTSKAKAARMAITRITAVTMLETLHEDPIQ